MQIGISAYLASQKPKFTSLYAKSDGGDILSNLIKNSDSKSVKMLQQQTEVNKSAILALSQPKSKRNEAKLAYAKQRFVELKKQLEQLKKMLNGDPKSLAKEAARLAKELKSVVKDYTDAVGEGGASIQNTDLSSEEVSTNVVEAKDGEVSASTEEAPKYDKINEIENPKTFEEKIMAIDAKFSEAQKNLDHENDNLPTPANDGVNENKQNLVETYAKSLLSPEHADFIKQVRKAANDIKFIMGMAKAKLEAAKETNNETDKLFDEFKNDIDEAVKTLTDFQNAQSKTNFSIGQNLALTT